MPKAHRVLVILTPAFAANEQDNWLPEHGIFVRCLNSMFTGLDVAIITFRYPEGPAMHYSWHSNKIAAIGAGKPGKTASLLRWKRAWSELQRIRRAHSIVGILSFFCGECAFVGHYFARRYVLRHHIWIMGQDARAGNRQVRRIRPHSGELVTISDFLAREFYRNYGIKPAHVIPIGIDADAFLKPSKERAIDLLGAGSLSKLKQYEVFIEVVEVIRQKMPYVRAAICGGGTEYQVLQAIIDRKDLNGHLQLYGERSHAEVLAAMQQSKILLHPSSYEGFGLVCTEALYAGAHVISFCRPMDAPIAHWHIVANKEEMTAKAIELLSSEGTEYTSVQPYKMEETVTRMMQLFSYAG